MKMKNQQNLNWFEKLKEADVICSRCHDSLNFSKDGSWRFTGQHWEHKCRDSNPQSGHFIGVSRNQPQKDKS
jgi:hypothetical protein